MTDNNAKGISTVDAAGIGTYSMLINGQWSQAADGLFDSVNRRRCGVVPRSRSDG